MATKHNFKFTPAHAELVIELGKQGASQKTMYAQLGISKATAARLKKEDPAFAEAIDLATVHAQSYWEQLILANVDNKAFNSRVAEIALRGQFHEDYRETRDQKVDLKAEVSIDFAGAVGDLIKQLKSAK